MPKQRITLGILAVTLILLGVNVRAEVYAYVTPEGHRLYTDQIMDGPGYRPANAAARHPKPGRWISKVSAAERARIDRMIDLWAPSYALDPRLVKAVVEVESSYQLDARSRKNAQGLMQLIPATAARFGVANPWNAEQNLRGGMAYLNWLMGQFEGNVPLVLAAYNAGENAVTKYSGIPPFIETRQYVAKVRQRYPRPKHPYVRIAQEQL